MTAPSRGIDPDAPTWARFSFTFGTIVIRIVIALVMLGLLLRLADAVS